MNEQELFARIAELKEAMPAMRLGQLIANMAVVARGTEPGAIWDLEDHELLAAVNWQLAEMNVRETLEVS